MSVADFIPPVFNDLPPEFAAFRPALEQNLKPYIQVSETLVGAPANQISSGALTRWQSKIGGTPYFPKYLDYPIDPNTGEPLILLTQINCADVPAIAGFDFPETGILQIYFGGIQFADVAIDQSFKVLYFPEVFGDEAALITDFSFLGELDRSWRQDYPELYRLDFSASRDLFWFSRYHHDDIQVPPDQTDLCDAFYDWLSDYYYTNGTDQLGSKLGGHPDLHGEVNEIEDDTDGRLLLELSRFAGQDDYLLFFIQDEALKTRNFDAVEFFIVSD